MSAPERARVGLLYGRALLSAARAHGTSTLPARTARAAAVPVGAERLAAYCRVCSFPLSDRVPVTYPHVLALPLQLDLLTDPSFPLPALGLVHLRTTAHERRPLRPGDVLDLEVAATRLLAHRKGTAVELHTRAWPSDDGTRAGSGEPVWSGRSVYLARRVTPPADADPCPDDPPVEVPDAPAARWDVAADTGRRYAAVSGDVNPIHLSPLLARPFGFPRPLAHGAWTAARALAAVQPRLRGAVELDVAFGAPLLLPSRVTLHVARRDAGADAARTGRAGAVDGEAWHVAVASADGQRRHLSGVVRSSAGHQDGRSR